MIGHTTLATVRAAPRCYARRSTPRRMMMTNASSMRLRAVFGKNDYRDLKGEQRSDYEYQDADDYFNCMGMLAAEGTYDRLEEWSDAGVHPIDMILLMACEESDAPKVEEVLNAGAQPTVQDPRTGNTPMDVCTDDDIMAMLRAKA
uniref:Uncharacterized protein n=1 Tax=Picochlorum oklahomense TaxID=249345 RepID=A0A7S1GHR2_9CHLO|mmetsp:Transcript_88/g.187  ORF Transcript_88/g.187 Transcript_88/m.187 type:complete len:146 (+) Transcript_88:79-516(+)